MSVILILYRSNRKAPDLESVSQVLNCHFFPVCIFDTVLKWLYFPLKYLLQLFSKQCEKRIRGKKQTFTLLLFFLVSRFGQEISHSRKIAWDTERGGQGGKSEHHTLAGKMESLCQRASSLRIDISLPPHSYCNCLLSSRMSWLRLRGATRTSSAWWATTCAAWTRLWASRGRKSTRSNWAARYAHTDSC